MTSPSASHALRLGAQEASIAARANVRDDREAPLLKERGPAGTSGGDLPDGTSEMAATNWHDGQITQAVARHVKPAFSCPGRGAAERCAAEPGPT
jgi:hypothetical protein